jgi:hypothetical protein
LSDDYCPFVPAIEPVPVVVLQTVVGRKPQSKTLEKNPSTSFIIHKDDIKQFLESIEKMPVDGYLANLLTDGPEAEVKEVIAGKNIQSGTKQKGKKRRTRKDNLSRAIDAAIKDIGKKPSLEELWKYFQDDKDETLFIEDTTDETIVWTDTKGIMHDTHKNTLANRLSRIKM